MGSAMRILVTGGLGYIGSNFAFEAKRQGMFPVIIDNLSNATLERAEILRVLCEGDCKVVVGDVRDSGLLSRILTNDSIDSVFHFAASKSVQESERTPESYYSNNIESTLSLLRAVVKHSVNNIVFSSTAAVYGEPHYTPIDEDHPLRPESVYARTKMFCEQMIFDVVRRRPQMAAVCLRYFNPVGADASGSLRDSSGRAALNVFPRLIRVLKGADPEFVVHGCDYPTKDGTGIRDYIHVQDLVDGHIASLRHIRDRRGSHVFNLGTGVGYSVRQLVSAVERLAGVSVPVRLAERRPGDVSVSFSDVRKANRSLQWRSSRTLDEMCASALQAEGVATIARPLRSHS